MTAGTLISLHCHAHGRDHKLLIREFIHPFLHSEALCAEDASRISDSALRSTEFVTLQHKFLDE